MYIGDDINDIWFDINDKSYCMTTENLWLKLEHKLVFSLEIFFSFQIFFI